MNDAGAKQKEHQLGEAQVAAEKIRQALEVVAERIEVAGSIRRRRLWVHDIDLVLIPQGEWIQDAKGNPRPTPGLSHWFDIPRLINDMGGRIIRKGPAIITAEVRGIQGDLYCATEETWGMLMLIKTGPKEFNIELCKRAQGLGMHLNPQIGLIKDGKCIASRTEEEILKALGLPYVEPVERDKAAGALARGEFEP